MLNHSHIAQIYGLEESNCTQFLVLELWTGESGHADCSRTHTTEEAVDIVKQIAEVLEGAHEKGIIHRNSSGKQCADQRWYVRAWTSGGKGGRGQKWPRKSMR